MICLLVDDEPGIREGLAALLRRKGHEIHTAGDCAAASARLAERSFDLVITDWRLPDGTAARFIADCPCPVVAVSGHPEEVEVHASVREVLTKPVSPARLLELLAATASSSTAPAGGRVADLPRDAREVVEAAIAVLGPAAPVEVHDDGAFVVLRAPLPSDAMLPALEELGGDLRVLAPGGRSQVELRLCRDGRPDPGLPVVRPGVVWPAAAEFAVDFHGTDAIPSLFGNCLERLVEARRRGARVYFLNVPDSLHFWASSQGKAHDMPMREKVGPRLPAVLADLWS
ncbi:MAG: response regulator [Planctomycetes bacterium]|nr:response regulator [Planctomycetota bacterium]MCC7062391.1 response regulator [Planctomycetota bacterium]